MKYLTLNTHSWIEDKPLEKLADIAAYIMENGIDVIALQEVNQPMNAKSITQDKWFMPLESEDIPVKEDNFALLLVRTLRASGYNYYWSWCCSHIGYGTYHEGTAILAKREFEATALVSSSMNEIDNYRTRKQLFGKFKDETIVMSGHYSWWKDEETKGFQYEWQQTMAYLNQYDSFKLLMGDFNAPSHWKNQSYSLMQDSFIDCYQQAKIKQGYHTIPTEIDGWKGYDEPMRIDYVLTSDDCEVTSYQVIFDGGQQAPVSDHFGVVVEIAD